MTLPENRPAPVISQSLRHGSAVPPAYASGPSVAARHLPTLWGVTLYTREALEYRRGGFHIRPYNPAQLSNYKEGARTLQGTTLLLQPPRIAYLFKYNQPHITPPYSAAKTKDKICLKINK